MEKLDLRQIIKEIAAVVKRHELEKNGEYCRWLWSDPEGKREMGVNPYGCADAANILYTINDFYCDEDTRRARVAVLQSMQDPESGMFTEKTHHTMHTTAHCAAAIQLFDAKPLYPIKGMHKYFDKTELYALLDGLRWKESPWRDSHEGAGVYAALVNADEMTEEFQKNYFDWFWENASPEYGFWKTGAIEKAPYIGISAENGQAAMYQYMAGGFHYMFNHEYAKMPLRYPEKVIDTCIEMYVKNALPANFAKVANFIEVDWLYCINRASRQTTHRNDEVRALIWDFACRMYDSFSGFDYETEESVNDLHMLFGGVCGLAEMQAALPGRIITEKPMRLVLDRRPFI